MSAFVELVLSRGYEEVSTAQICAGANIGRSTFYLHYTGKQQLLEESLKHPSAGLAACVGGELDAPQLVPLLEHFREQRAVNRVFFEAPIRGLWVRSLAALIEPRLPRGPSGAAAVPRSLLALVIAEAQIALITHWLTAYAGLRPMVVAEQLLAGTRALSAGAAAGPSAAHPGGRAGQLACDHREWPPSR
jgi:AcrR family transcriptional regulator